MSVVVARSPLRTIVNHLIFRIACSPIRGVTTTAPEVNVDSVSGNAVPDDSRSNGVEVDGKKVESDDTPIYIKPPKNPNLRRTSWDTKRPGEASVPMLSGPIVGKRFYKEVKIRRADDGNSWNVMLDYRTLKTPWKRVLKIPTLAMAMAVAAEWEFQQKDGIRPFTMPLMLLACTALERVPFTRRTIIEELIKKFDNDLIFFRDPDKENVGIKERQKTKLCPLLDWVESEFGFKPIVFESFYGGKQEDGLVKAVEKLLKEANDCQLAAIDAISAAGHSLIIAVALCRGKLQIEDAIILIRIEEDLQLDKWGFVEGGHDIDIAYLKVQIASAVVLLELSKDFLHEAGMNQRYNIWE